MNSYELSEWKDFTSEQRKKFITGWEKHRVKEHKTLEDEESEKEQEEEE